MARVTVDDCLQKLPNRFELVLVAGARARKLGIGSAEALVEEENDKPTVLALREIAAGKIDISYIDSKPEDSSKQAEELLASSLAAVESNANPEQVLESAPLVYEDPNKTPDDEKEAE